MNFRDLDYYLEPADWVFIGYLIGLLVWGIAESFSSPAATATATSTERDVVGGWDSATLSEQAFERLEQGEEITVDRWHGGELVLRGDVDSYDSEE